MNSTRRALLVWHPVLLCIHLGLHFSMLLMTSYRFESCENFSRSLIGYVLVTANHSARPYDRLKASTRV